MSALPDAAIERLIESQRVLIQERARHALAALDEVLADEWRLKAYGMTHSQFARLVEARDGLKRVLP